MRLSTLFLLMVVLLAIGHEAVATTETTSYTPTALVSGVTALVVETEVEGTINWHSSSGEEVVINVTTSTSAGESSGDGMITEPTSENLGKNGSCAIAFIEDDLTTTDTLTIYANECMGSRADVDIYVPNNFTFGNVSLKSVIGSIEVDEELIDSGIPLACSSGLDKQECPSCCSGHGKCVGGECMCNIGYRNGTEDCSNRTEITFEVHISPADPVIIDGIIPDGAVISLLGEKTENGTVLSVDQFQVLESDGNTTYVFLEDGAPRTSTHSSGAIINYEWSDDVTGVHITAISPDGSFQTTININFTNVTTEEENPSKRQANKPTHEIALPDTYKDNPQDPIRHQRKVRRQSGAGAAIAIVTVTSCGEPEDNAIVGATAYRGYKKRTKKYSKAESYRGVKGNSSGVFLIKIPTIPVSKIEKGIDIVQRIVNVLSKVCDWYEKLSDIIKKVPKVFLSDILDKWKVKKAFKKLSDILDKWKVKKALKTPANFICLGLVAPWAVKGCYVTFTAIKFYCEHRDIISQLVTKVLDKAIDLSRDESILLTPYAIFPGYNKVSAAGQVITLTPGFTGTLPNTFTIMNDQINPQIISISVSPFDPDPRQNYAVTVIYKCSTADTRVHMSIVGTDGYSNAKYCSGAVNTCVLHVPGAADLVEDTVTTTLSNPSTGYVTTRTVHIIF